MSELELFDGAEGLKGPEPQGEGAVVSHSSDAPLASRMRPANLDEFRGQEHLLAPGKPLRAMVEGGQVQSMILWGPPGSGKTTLAHLLAKEAAAAFVSFSAVTEGVARVREVIKEAGERRRALDRGTILFCDEIHRFNKAQQDAFLPHVEAGTVTLIGATTENPSFEVVRPLLSRAPVYVLEPIGIGHLVSILKEALGDQDRGLGRLELKATDEVLDRIADHADGDARRALGVLERAAVLAGANGEITMELAAEALQRRFAAHDKSGETHYNQLSAYHKSLRGSDPQGALYWMARMIEGGEDPMTLFRRAIAMAAEDIGLADPNALQLAMAARDAFHMLGPPEGYLPLAEMTIYLATAPKSNRGKVALDRAREAARKTPAEPVPIQFRNAPTGLMKELGYGEGYRYDHAEEEGYAGQSFLPSSLDGSDFYEPGALGFEAEILERMQKWLKMRQGRREEIES